MTDWKLLEDKIEDSGLKRGYIYGKLGMSRYAWSKRKARNTEFTAGQIQELCKMLHITSLKEKESIFFADDVGL